VSNGSFYFDQPYNKTNTGWRHRSMVRFISLGFGNTGIVYCPRAFGTWAMYNIPLTSGNKSHHWPRCQPTFV